MPYRIVLTPDAKRELREIRAFIHSGSAKAASGWAKEIRRHIQTLSRNPLRCPIAPERLYLGEELRELFFGAGNRGTYRILFIVVNNAVVVVVHIRHGSRLPADFSVN